mgnify:CR=1 FL=1
MRATVAGVRRLSRHSGDRKRPYRSRLATITIIPLFNPIESRTRSSVLLFPPVSSFLSVSCVQLGQSSRENGTAALLLLLFISFVNYHKAENLLEEISNRSDVRCGLQLAGIDKFDREIVLNLT